MYREGLEHVNKVHVWEKIREFVSSQPFVVSC